MCIPVQTSGLGGEDEQLLDVPLKALDVHLNTRFELERSFNDGRGFLPFRAVFELITHQTTTRKPHLMVTRSHVSGCGEV